MYVISVPENLKSQFIFLYVLIGILRAEIYEAFLFIDFTLIRKYKAATLTISIRIFTLFFFFQS